MPTPLKVRNIESMYVPSNFFVPKSGYSNPSGLIYLQVSAMNILVQYEYPSGIYTYYNNTNLLPLYGSISYARSESMVNPYITIMYDGGKTKNLYLPEFGAGSAGLLLLFYADDGSSYYDSALTQLARAAPKEGFSAITQFTANKTQAYAGDDIVLSLSIKNTGTVPDDLFARIKEQGNTISEQSFSAVAVGNTVIRNLSFTMPQRDVILILESGHIE